MVNPIPGGTAFDFGAAAQATAAQPLPTTTSAAPVKQPAAVEPVADTVKLSPGAQVRLLRTQGQTVSEIVLKTALSAETVNSYLGIAQAPPPAAASTGK
jgi:hypothetical protein